MAGALLIGSAPAADPLPRGWEKMEIESKWDITARLYEQLISKFSKNGTYRGYRLEVRWRGVPRRFVDTYYDSFEGDLGRALHTLRHRARYQSNIGASDQPASRPQSSEPVLDAATWSAEWEVVQYKSTPCRIAATWFREETGECRLRDEAGQELCIAGKQVDPADILQGAFPAHPAMRSLGRDHPNLSLSRLRPILHVSDYRYRVSLYLNERELFELSVDRLYSTDLVTGSRAVPAYEAELEIIDPNKSAEDVRRLLKLSAHLQTELGLKPSTHSKGRVEAQVGGCSA